MGARGTEVLPTWYSDLLRTYLQNTTLKSLPWSGIFFLCGGASDLLSSLCWLLPCGRTFSLGQSKTQPPPPLLVLETLARLGPQCTRTSQL